VSRVVMMETFRQYFDYSLQGICGIPNLTILGTVEDWERIYERVQALGQYELEWWTQRLLPICEEFIQAVSGNPNLEFWRSIALRIHLRTLLECGIYTITKVSKLIPSLPHPILEHKPPVLNRVQIWRIRR